VIEALQAERERGKILLAQCPESERTQQNYLEEGGYFDRWDADLDKAGFGPRWLSQPEIAEVVREAMHYRDGKVFDLHAFCIMPNHVHTVFEPLSRAECHSTFRSEYHFNLRKSDCQSDILPLNKIMQSMKRHTARQANQILGRAGAFWQDESYDRVIRDGEEYARIIPYVLENPVKAGLASKWDEWPWTYCK
jgi:putative transposase